MPSSNIPPDVAAGNVHGDQVDLVSNVIGVTFKPPVVRSTNTDRVIDQMLELGNAALQDAPMQQGPASFVPIVPLAQPAPAAPVQPPTPPQPAQPPVTSVDLVPYQPPPPRPQPREEHPVARSNVQCILSNSTKWPHGKDIGHSSTRRRSYGRTRV